MGWSGQEDGMDVMKEIIQKEIQSISSLEERVIFKNLMEGVFLSLYDTNREMYEGLERRIKEELDYDKNRYYVKTGIVEREFFDASHHLLSPMGLCRTSICLSRILLKCPGSGLRAP